jgi:alkanesulfonate monooxygenase SsuD/methylene tetrahydromethanopterin reductase-like flavin-dependent oxidoreductase (luciferase family)
MEPFTGDGIKAMNQLMRELAQVVEKNRFTVMRITSHSLAMGNHRSNVSSPWLALLAVGLALATLAPVAVVASRLI